MKKVKYIPGRKSMNVMRVLAVILILGGILGLAYGGFSYTRQTHQADIGPIELAIKEKSRVNIPIWAGVGAIMVGGGIFLAKKKS
jgi:uncharacterized membrane protein YidH (DUF202 family)